MNKQTDDTNVTEFERRSRELFDASVSDLDAHTRSRLNQARHAALQAVTSGKRAVIVRWWLPIGSAAALALFAILSLQFIGGNSTPGAQTTAAMEDMEIIASADELDLLQNDLDFYDWLESPEDNAPESEAT